MLIYKELNAADWEQVLARPVKNLQEMEQQVLPVLKAVKSRKDAALYAYTRQFDNVALDSLQVTLEEKVAGQQLDENLKAAIRQAKANITAFHQVQLEETREVETMPGVRCWRESVPIQKVGLYIPAGSAPLFSTVLMLGQPAMLAGCPEIIMCTPPRPDGTIHPAILFAAGLVGIQQIYKVGGAQAIAAMAYGTESIPKVYKIFGPGNQFVTVAKQLVNREGTAIDIPAGPSEVLILADATANPAFVAADLLAQAEHGADSQCLLVTTSEQLLAQVEQEIYKQTETASRSEIIKQALENCRLVLVQSLEEAIALTNAYAPEHLIIATEKAEDMGRRIHNAGSVFLGHFTPVSVGDYASGTNHTLPTNGAAYAHSGVSLDSFIKKITFQQLSPTGLKNIGPIVEQMAEAEQLTAHRDAVAIRLKSLYNL